MELNQKAQNHHRVATAFAHSMIRTALTVAATTTFLIARPNTLTKAMATTADSKLPTLKGMVFDMDDTLVKANLDISAMYKEIFGVDPTENDDILKAIAALDPQEKERSNRIVHDMEEKSRKKMTLMPGCTELLNWLSHHKIPSALVTRNTQITANVFMEKLAASDVSFERCITRDDNGFPPKPDPTAMKLLAKDTFECDTSEILMVGDSIPNDIAFGKNAGTQTALLVEDSESSHDDAAAPAAEADICVSHLTQLPRHLWKTFSIDGPLGNTPEANQRPLHGSPAPTPQSELCVAAAAGNVDAIRSLLENACDDEPDEETGNTALIWACETGNAEIANILLESKKNDEQFSSYVNHRGFLGATALNRAARRGHTNCLQQVLLNCSSVDMDLPNLKLQYPLHFAAFKKNPEALSFLLEQGANPWVLDRKGRTPLEDTSCETCQSLLREAMK